MQETNPKPDILDPDLNMRALQSMFGEAPPMDNEYIKLIEKMKIMKEKEDPDRVVTEAEI
jgi:hypothetical protein